MVTPSRMGCVLALTVVSAWAQSAAPRFEVASIKPSQPGRPFDVIQTLPGGTFKGTHVTVHTLMRMAYDVFDYQIRGEPGWLESDTYDVVAKAEGDPDRDEMRLLVRSLLAERLALSYHRESREAAGYAIVVAKKGPKLHPSDADTRPTKQIGRSFVTGRKMTIDSLAGSLAHLLRCPVADETGLTAQFDCKLEWTPESPRQEPEPGVS